MTEDELKKIEVDCKEVAAMSWCAAQAMKYEAIVLSIVPDLLKAIRQGSDDMKSIKCLLDAAKCPNCDGSGGFMIDDGSPEGQACQCQWCYEKNEWLK